jgi:hypothetical protein
MTSVDSTDSKRISKSLISSGLFTLFLSILFVYFEYGKTQIGALSIALIYFMCFYFTLFALGKAIIIQTIQAWIAKSKIHVFYFPVSLLMLYFLYLLLNGADPLAGNPWMLVYIVLFPVLVFSFIRLKSEKLNWINKTAKCPSTAMVLILYPT